MTVTEISILASRLIITGFASFFSILLWSRTRDLAIFFIVSGIIVSYIDILYTILEISAVIQKNDFLYNGIPVIKILLTCLPYVLFSIGFIIMIKRKRI